MEKKRRAKITALGRYVPPKVITNDDLAKVVETSHDWIVERTGIVERHAAEPGTPSSEVGAHAVADLLQRRGIEADEIEMIIFVTVTPDMMFPATACVLQNKIRASRAWGFDLSAACSGFLYGLTVGAQFIESGAHKKVLVVGADVMTSILNPQDRTTLILFGDGAGAVLLEPSAEDEDAGILDYINEIDGSGGQFLYMPGGGSLHPPTHETVDKKMEELSRTILERNHLAPADVNAFIAHQANIRIIEGATQKLGVAQDRVVKNIHKYGNTTAATIPLAIGDALDTGLLKKGDTVLFAAVGAGFTAGALLARWAY